MNQKKKQDDVESEELIKIENIYVGAIERGLSISDMENMDLGDVIDYVITYNNLHDETEDDETTTRKATQSDWDNF